MTDTKIAIFKGKQILKTIYKSEWWFSAVDVVQVLTDQLEIIEQTVVIDKTK